MPTITVRQHTLAYFEHHSPETIIPPLLLIHGAGGQHTHWPPQLRRLDGATVYAPDLPGHGQSDGSGCRTVADYAAVLLEFMDSLNLDRVIAAGHSMGGAIAQELALGAPDRIAGLVLIATGARLRVAPQILENVLTHYDQVVETIIQVQYGSAADDQLKQLGIAQLRQNDPQVVHGDFIACDAFDVMGRLGQITAPALMIGGSADLMTPPKYLQYLVDHLPNAEFHLIENAGHMVAAEFPDRVAGIVHGWLGEHWG